MTKKKPGIMPTVLLGLATFAVLFEFLAFQLNSGNDPALGKTALAAARSRNLPALIEANGKLVETCEGCHKQFKPELPTEGIGHQPPHSESHKSN